MNFQVPQDGFISLWEVHRSGQVRRLFPAGTQRAFAVRATRRYTYQHTFTNQEGERALCLVWTPTLQGHPDHPQAQHACAVSKQKRHVPHPVGDMQVLGFPIPVWRDARNMCPTAQTTRVPYAQGRVFLVAVSANTDGLQWTHVDAWHFKCVIESLFHLERTFYKEEATKKDFHDFMRELRALVMPQDLVIIFMSAHGYSVPDDQPGEEADGLDEAIVLYHKRDSRMRATIVSAKHYVRDDELAAWIRDLNTQQVILVLDTCYSGGAYKGPGEPRVKFFGSGRGTSRTCMDSTSAMSHGLLMTDRDDQTGKGVLFAASRECEVAYEWPQKGGLFTSAFVAQLQALQNSNLLTVFVETTRNMPRGKFVQHPVAVGDIELARALVFVPRVQGAQ
jgi:hypothetical protein